MLGPGDVHSCKWVRHWLCSPYRFLEIVILLFGNLKPKSLNAYIARVGTHGSYPQQTSAFSALKVHELSNTAEVLGMGAASLYLPVPPFHLHL